MVQCSSRLLGQREPFRLSGNDCDLAARFCCTRSIVQFLECPAQSQSGTAEWSRYIGAYRLSRELPLRC